MLNDNLLENRLNQAKNNSSVSTEYITDPTNTTFFSTLSTILAAILIIVKAFVYGYTLKLLLATDWRWWQFVVVGISVNFILTYIYDLIRPKQL